LCFLEGNPAGVKAILSEMGIGKDNLRLPLTPVSENTRVLIKEELEKILAINL
jgi:4-hydroxy-tetrahydrodipicolinate synthase